MPVEEAMLSEEDLAAVMRVLSRKPAGRYELSRLFGAYWRGVHPRAYGKWFRAWVRAEAVPGVRWVRKKSNNCHEYEWSGPAA